MSDVWGVAPRLLQGHSPSGEPQCMDVVGEGPGSGEVLVNGSEPSHSLVMDPLLLLAGNKKASPCGKADDH